MMEEGYEIPKEPFFLKKWISFFKEKKWKDIFKKKDSVSDQEKNIDDDTEVIKEQDSRKDGTKEDEE